MAASTLCVSTCPACCVYRRSLFSYKVRNVRLTNLSSFVPVPAFSAQCQHHAEIWLEMWMLEPGSLYPTRNCIILVVVFVVIIHGFVNAVIRSFCVRIKCLYFDIPKYVQT